MRWDRSGGLSPNIEDRRDENPEVAPSSKDALLRGLPQSPFEWKLYQELQRRKKAVKRGERVDSDPNLPVSVEAHRGQRQARGVVDTVLSVSPDLERQAFAMRLLGPKPKDQQQPAAGAPPETERARQHGLWLNALRDMRAREGKQP